MDVKDRGQPRVVFLGHIHADRNVASDHLVLDDEFRPIDALVDDLEHVDDRRAKPPRRHRSRALPSARGHQRRARVPDRFGSSRLRFLAERTPVTRPPSQPVTDPLVRRDPRSPAGRLGREDVEGDPSANFGACAPAASPLAMCRSVRVNATSAVVRPAEQILGDATYQRDSAISPQCSVCVSATEHLHHRCEVTPRFL